MPAPSSSALGALALVLLAARPAFADAASPVSPLTVTAPKGSLTQPDVPQQQAEALAAAGSVAFIDAEALKGRYASTLREVLKDTPGVFVQARYGQELRLSVRGSGAARGFHMRGIELLQDGIPWNLADGSGDFYAVDPASLRSAVVYKGGNGLQFGAATLGGAINVVTPTAYTAVAPNVLRLEGGSFSTLRGSASLARAWGDWDAIATVTANTSQGSRAHSRSNDLYLTGNLGYRFGPGAETRLYVAVNDTRQQLPGALTLSQALADPRQAAFASAAPIAGGDQQRNDRVQRIADRTTVRLGDGQVEVDVFAYHKTLFHPIFQVIDQDGWTWGGDVRYRGTSDLAGHRNALIVGARAISGVTQARQFLNLAGARSGGLTADAEQKATNLEAYVEDRFSLTPTLTLALGAKGLADERRLDNRFAPARSGRRIFYGLDPKAGLLWQATPQVQAFANITRSRDVPDFSDLAQANAAGPSFAPLKAQTAWTWEAGARGGRGRLRFDVTLYRAEIDGELLQYTVDPSVPATTFNAGRTVHQGVEAQASADLLGEASAPERGDRLTLTGQWTLNDFRFSGDRQYGDNRIAGAPPHVLRFEARYVRRALAGARNAYLAPQVDWAPRGAFADQRNSLRAPGYAVLGLEAGFEPAPGVLVFLEGRNLTDAAYVSDISTAIAATASSAIFYPGDRRSLYGGVRLAF